MKTKRRIVVLPYKMASQSAGNLSKRLGVKRIIPDPDATKFVARPDDVIINWGNSQFTPKMKAGTRPLLLNTPESIRNAADKLRTFELLHNNGVPAPEFTTSKSIASRWLKEGETSRVFCRTVLNGHSGKGIVIAREPKELVDAPLYVKGVAKQDEYRIHVMRDTVFDEQQKKAKKGIRDEMGPDWESGVRSHANGWVFTRAGVTAPKKVKEAAIKTITALGLDFGAVDIVETKKGKVFVLEANTSPGLEGTTLDNYEQMFKKFLTL